MENELGTPSAAATGQVAEAWARIRGRLREEVGEVEYRSWLRQMTLSAIEGEEAVILLPTRFLRDWVRSHYGDRLRNLWMAENLGVRRVEIRVAPEGRAPEAEPALAEGLAAPSPAGLSGAA
ncbi:DnaA N-terminal domain-containing protein, partial [Teichococcus cervicalis]